MRRNIYNNASSTILIITVAVALLIPLLLFFSSSSANAAEYSNRFRANPQYDRVDVKWMIVNDADSWCRPFVKSKPGYRYYVIEACALVFSEKQKCIIITKPVLTMETFGHELRHCFEGAWHD